MIQTLMNVVVLNSLIESTNTNIHKTS